MNSRSERPRTILGVQVTAQSIALLTATVVLMALVGLAVLSWLERLG